MLASFVEDYGSQAVLAAPIDKGFNRLAWLFPYLVAALALVGVFVTARRWSRPSAQAVAGAPGSIRRLTLAWTMSSETSIEPRGDDALHPWQLFTLAGLIGATIVVFVSRGQTPSGIILLSLIIFTAAIVGVATWRTLSPLTGRDEPTGPQMLGGRTRAALEREKALVLRSIKELEFDRAMGKMSEKDFAEMSARLRARATGLIRQLDAGERLSRTDREGDCEAGEGWRPPDPA